MGEPTQAKECPDTGSPCWTCPGGECKWIEAERKITAGIDRRAAPKMGDSPAAPEDVAKVREAIHFAISALDSHLGDTDPPFPPDATDEDIEQLDPLFAACQKLSTADDAFERLTTRNRALEGELAKQIDANSLEYQRGRADQARATTVADYSWKPRAEQAEGVIAEHNKRCERECSNPMGCFHPLGYCPRRYIIEVPT